MIGQVNPDAQWQEPEPSTFVTSMKSVNEPFQDVVCIKPSSILFGPGGSDAAAHFMDMGGVRSSVGNAVHGVVQRSFVLDHNASPSVA